MFRSVERKRKRDDIPPQALSSQKPRILAAISCYAQELAIGSCIQPHVDEVLVVNNGTSAILQWMGQRPRLMNLDRGGAQGILTRACSTEPKVRITVEGDSVRAAKEPLHKGRAMLPRAKQLS